MEAFVLQSGITIEQFELSLRCEYPSGLIQKRAEGDDIVYYLNEKGKQTCVGTYTDAYTNTMSSKSE